MVDDEIDREAEDLRTGARASDRQSAPAAPPKPRSFLGGPVGGHPPMEGGGAPESPPGPGRTVSPGSSVPVDPPPPVRPVGFGAGEPVVNPAVPPMAVPTVRSTRSPQGVALFVGGLAVLAVIVVVGTALVVRAVSDRLEDPEEVSAVSSEAEALEVVTAETVGDRLATFFESQDWALTRLEAAPFVELPEGCAVEGWNTGAVDRSVLRVNRPDQPWEELVVSVVSYEDEAALEADLDRARTDAFGACEQILADEVAGDLETTLDPPDPAVPGAAWSLRIPPDADLVIAGPAPIGVMAAEIGVGVVRVRIDFCTCPEVGPRARLVLQRLVAATLARAQGVPVPGAPR